MSITRHTILLLITLLPFFAGCTKETYSEPQVSTEPQVATVAVWDLDNLSPAQDPGFDMGELLAAKVIETLQESGTYQLVEREQLILALKELERGSTLLVEESTRLEVGQYWGARFMVFGSYLVIGKVMRLDLRLVEVETGRVVKAARKETSAVDLNSWPRIAQEAAEELI